jgi:hypothetical protein
MNECCNICKFYFDGDDVKRPGNNYLDNRDEVDGYCRRYPPIVRVGTRRGHSFIFTEVKKGDWCGEFRQKIIYVRR